MTGRLTGRLAGRLIGRLTGRQVYRQPGRLADSHRGLWAGSMEDKGTVWYTDRLAGWQTGRQTMRLMGRESERHADLQTDSSLNRQLGGRHTSKQKVRLGLWAGSKAD